MLDRVRRGKLYAVHHDWVLPVTAVLMLVATFMALVWAPPIYAPMTSTFEEGGDFFASGQERFTVDGATETGPTSMHVDSIEETDTAYVIDGTLPDGRNARMTVDKGNVKSARREESGGDLVGLILGHRVFQGEVWRMFYFHVGVSWVMALAFFHTFVASVLYLWREKPRWDIVAGASAEVGFVLATLVLVTGSIWAKPAWGTWWDWDPRLTTSLVLWLIYAGYLSLKGEGQERSAAVYGVLAFATVPITFISIRMWRTIHPTPIRSTGIGIDTPILLTMLVAVLAMTMLFTHVMSLRVRLGIAEQELAKAGRSR